MTESRGSLLSRRESNTLPGASASTRFDVIAITIKVAMRLRLNESAWMISTGRRKPGPDPCGSASSAHHTSPRLTTNSPVRYSPVASQIERDQARRSYQPYTLGRVAPWSQRYPVPQDTSRGLFDRIRCGTGRDAWLLAPQPRKAHRESKLPSSCPKYNRGYTPVSTPLDNGGYHAAITRVPPDGVSRRSSRDRSPRSSRSAQAWRAARCPCCNPAVTHIGVTNQIKYTCAILSIDVL